MELYRLASDLLGSAGASVACGPPDLSLCLPNEKTQASGLYDVVAAACVNEREFWVSGQDVPIMGGSIVVV